MEITETPELIIYETDDLEPPIFALTLQPRVVKGPDGEPLLLPRDTRMITTRGYLNLLGGQ